MNKKLIESEAKDYLGITLALVLYSFGFTFFLMPYEIVTALTCWEREERSACALSPFAGAALREERRRES